MTIPQETKDTVTKELAGKLIEKMSPFEKLESEIDEKLKTATGKKKEALEKKKQQLEISKNETLENAKSEMLDSGFSEAMENTYSDIETKFNTVTQDVTDITVSIPAIATCIGIITSAGASMGLIKNTLGMITKANSDLSTLTSQLKASGLDDPDTITKLIPGYDTISGALENLKGQLEEKESESETAQEAATEDQKTERQEKLDDIDCPVCGQKKLKVSDNNLDTVICNSCGHEFSWLGDFQ